MKALAVAAEQIIVDSGHQENLKIAYVTGDNLLRMFFFYHVRDVKESDPYFPKAFFDELKQMSGEFQHLEGGGTSVSAWPRTPVAVNAYSKHLATLDWMRC